MKTVLFIFGVIIIAVYVVVNMRPPIRNRNTSAKPTPISSVSVTPVPTVVPPSLLEVTSPTMNGKLGNQLKIIFKVSQAPARIAFSLRDTTNRILAQGYEDATSTMYTITSTYAVPAVTTGVLDIHIVDDPQIISIPVNFPKPQHYTQIYLYSSDCRQLVGVNRLINNPKDQGRELLAALISGPTTMDVQRGLKTAIPATTRLAGYNIVSNIATVNFSSQVVKDIATCPINLLPNQVKRTLMQVPGVSDVTIAVDNRLPSNLQP